MKYIKEIITVILLFLSLNSMAFCGGKITKPWIGVQIGELTQDLAINYGYYPNSGGAFVHYVFPAGPAADGGLESGDIIIALNGKNVSSPRELAKIISTIKYTADIDLTVVRNSKKKVITVSVINNPYNSSASNSGSDGKPWFGVSLKNINKDVADAWGLPVTSGLYVLSVYDGSPASKSGIKKGDIIVQVNGEMVKTYEELLALVTPIKPGKIVNLGVWHSGKKKSFKIKF